jgi:hypothetical protein
MKPKKTFEPGDIVTTFTGHVGMVISQEEYWVLRGRLKEGRKPGRYFCPGCCQHPDYVIQIPVLFEDNTWDVMRAMNLRKAPNLPQEKRAKIQGIIRDHALLNPSR